MILTDEEISLMAHNADDGDWNDLNYQECWHNGFKAAARDVEAAIQAKLADQLKDAARYQWLKDQFSGVDFEWGKLDDESDGRQVIVFDWPGLPVGADCDKNIDAAIANTKESK